VSPTCGPRPGSAGPDPIVRGPRRSAVEGFRLARGSRPTLRPGLEVSSPRRCATLSRMPRFGPPDRLGTSPSSAWRDVDRVGPSIVRGTRQPNGRVLVDAALAGSAPPREPSEAYCRVRVVARGPRRPGPPMDPMRAPPRKPLGVNKITGQTASVLVDHLSHGDRGDAVWPASRVACSSEAERGICKEKRAGGSCEAARSPLGGKWTRLETRPTVAIGVAR